MEEEETAEFIHSGNFGIVERVRGADGVMYARKTFDPTDSVADFPDLLEKARQRFLRETQIQAQIRHPNIMPVLDSGVTDGAAWFTMPLADESRSTTSSASGRPAR